MKDKKEIDVLSIMLQQISSLQEARDLLESVFIEHGPYRNCAISTDTWNKVQRYFKFDDSE